MIRIVFAGACIAAAAAYVGVNISQEPRGKDDHRGCGAREGDDRQSGEARRRPGPPPPDPILELFDKDRDGEISASEIDDAVRVLKKLDANQDGKLTPDELPRPPRPRRPGEEDFRRRPAREREQPEPKNAAPGTVVFRGGYDTDPRDGGRPVALIAAALGVKSEVFRDAFSRVRPARGGRPSAERQRANKKVLMDALGKHGVTNDRLDEVSNHYRYRPESGELWRHTPARATATIRDGKVVGIRITNPGAGYLTPPTVTVAGYPDVRIKATIAFSRDLRTNGRVTSLTIVEK